MFHLTPNQSFLLGVGALWVFSAAVSALDSPDAQSGRFYRWFFKFSKMIAGDLASSALGKYLPGVSVANVTKVAIFVLAIGLMLMSGAAFAQTASPAPAVPSAAATDVQNLYAAGVSYNVGGTPAIAGTALYAHAIADTGTYAFTAVDALPNTVKPFTVSTNLGAGVAQKVATLAGIPIYVPTAVGISWSGQNTGWQWNAGALASIHLKGKCAQCYIMPSVRFLKSSVSGGTGYQPIIGVLFGWGQ